MNRTRRAFLTGLITAAAALAVSPAQAMWQRYSAVYCSNTDYYYNLKNAFVVPSGWGMGNYSSSEPAILACPVDDDNRFPKSYVNGLNVHVHDGTTADQVWAYACVTTYPYNGYDCGGYDSTGTYSNTGDYTLHPGLSVWQDTTNHTGDFAFLFVYLPDNYNQGTSNIRGFYTHT